MAINKLTPTEIRETVEKIRKKYDEYSYKFFKASKHKANFETRYRQALKDNVDISSFLLAEISAITELVKREEDKIAEKKAPPAEAPGPNFIDQIMEENRRRILKYPAVEIHPDAQDEIGRLCGALHTVEQDYWPRLYNLLRNTSYSLNSKVMINLETQLHHLGGSGKESVPVRLERYLARLRKFPRDFLLVEKEGKDYILEVAFFLHQFEETLADARKKQEDVFNVEELKQLDAVIEYIKRLIADFRLKDLRRR